MFELTVEDVFRIKGRGVVATGRVASGAVRVGDRVEAGGTPLVVKGVEMFRKKVDAASAGDTVGLLFDDAAGDLLARGTVITGDGSAAPVAPSGTAEDLGRQIGLGEPQKKRRWFGRGA
jgi:elongation factor Tu